MKRTYNSPEIKVVCVEQHLMADSTSLSGKQGEKSFSVTFSDDEYSGEAASRRGGGCWDDED